MTLFVKPATGFLVACLSFTPVGAAPILAFPAAPDSSSIILVQDASPGIWRGYRGVRQPRPGYRRGDDGWWYPLAAFAAGAIIGGAIGAGNNDDSPPPPPPDDHRLPPPQQARDVRAGIFSPEHYAWCAKRYRTYRAGDNTYVPRAGVRAQCQSPYGY